MTKMCDDADWACRYARRNFDDLEVWVTLLKDEVRCHKICRSKYARSIEDGREHSIAVVCAHSVAGGGRSSGQRLLESKRGRRRTTAR